MSPVLKHSNSLCVVVSRILHFKKVLNSYDKKRLCYHSTTSMFLDRRYEQFTQVDDLNFNIG